VTGDFNQTNDCNTTLAVKCELHCLCCLWSQQALGSRNGQISVLTTLSVVPYRRAEWHRRNSPHSDPRTSDFRKSVDQHNHVHPSRFIDKTRHIAVDHFFNCHKLRVFRKSDTAQPYNAGADLQCFRDLSPTSSGSKTGALTITSPAFAIAHVVPLSAQESRSHFSPDSLSFGNVQIGTTSTKTTTFTNSSKAREYHQHCHAHAAFLRLIRAE
jgi:hypothetical protein